jgi:lipoprotein-releasing system ATP-binding protein
VGVLDARGISKSFPTPEGGLEVLRDVSIQMEHGDAVSIMGPSGSGKSTFLYILGGLDAPTAGTVSLDGENPYAMDEARQAAFRNRKVGFLFQDHCLLPQLSVMENVLAPVLVDGPPKPEALKRAADLIGQVGLSPRAHHRPGELSGGEKQRAALARALIRQPALLLCDEPTGNLDHASAETVASLLVDLHRIHGTMLVVVTHSADLAGRFPRRLEMHEATLRPR